MTFYSEGQFSFQDKKGKIFQDQKEKYWKKSILIVNPLLLHLVLCKIPYEIK